VVTTVWRVRWQFVSDTVGELYVALVTSTKANARLISIDASAALAMPGVIGFLNHTSVPGSNLMGCANNAEEIFATTEACTVYWFDDEREVFNELCFCICFFVGSMFCVTMITQKIVHFEKFFK